MEFVISFEAFLISLRAFESKVVGNLGDGPAWSVFARSLVRRVVGGAA